MNSKGRGHASDERDFIHQIRGLRQVLTDSYPGQTGRDRSEWTAYFRGRVGFGIEKIQVTRTTIEPNQNTGSRFGRLVPMSAWGGCSESTSMEKLAQTHSQRREATNTNKISACDSVTSLEKTHDSSTFID